MAELNVIFDVPEAIAEGLKNGVYERIGGVIRRVGDKQIVMWLQEGVLLERDTAEQLLKQGAEHVQLLRQQAEQLQMLGVQQQLIMGLQVANLAVSVVGFALTLYKLQGIENQLRHMDGKLDDIRQGVEWLDVRQMISRLAPLHASLQHVREAGLYRNAAMMQQQLGIANSQLAESQSYFGGLLQHVSERSFEYMQPGEFAAAYRGWVMSAQGRLQVLARLGEMDLAAHLANEFKERHAGFGQRLQQSLNNPALRLMAGQQGEANHARLLSIAEQAVGAHEIIRGNVMQLEFMRDEQLDLPILNSPAGYQGLAFCRVG
ncbi:hypothetical protein SBP02_18390 [Pseudomonas benzenivorans]|uniref:Nitrate and nitrite sensing n=1 Tax=Pseudomonas benzenivorans TaxID=556533 RepID=A0ABZ0PUY2_9PSED|nr:hypothetical protein [Pseudomonas benzenivorans]WPC04701.1 hypothetical protein SBP02_18390 [Pseudomonas benzenivorans]